MPFENVRGAHETNEQYLATVPVSHPAHSAILAGHLQLVQVDPNYSIVRIHTQNDGRVKYDVTSESAKPFEDDSTRSANAVKARLLAQTAARVSKLITEATNRDNRIWVVYTTDSRFATSPTRFDSAYNTEELAREQAGRLNKEYHKSGIPESVAFSNVVPLLVQDELESWDD
jgi:5-hydroxyisourate hydrolase-like protein (transthyretin family)